MLKHLNGLLCLQFKWNEWLLDYDKITLCKKCPYSELLNADQYNSEYGHFLRSISPYSVQTRENADQNNSEHGHFLRRSLRIQSKCGEMPTMRTNFTQCGIVVLRVFYHCQISPFFPFVCWMPTNGFQVLARLSKISSLSSFRYTSG